MAEQNTIPKMMYGAWLLGPKHIEIRETPVAPPDQGEILLHVRAAVTCGTDVKVYRQGGHPRMLTPPALFGHEMAGVVAAAGKGVTNLAVGDAVVVANSAPCLKCTPCRANRENLCQDLKYLNGAFAEYLLVPKRFVHTSTYHKPASLDFEKAALAEPLACVLHGMEACGINTRDARAETVEVIVYGAGPIGLLHVAALKRLGCLVIMADPNRPRLEVAQALGADEIVTIERDGGQAETVKTRTTNGLGADFAIDCTGVPAVWADAIASVRPGGVVNLFGGCPADTMVSLDTQWIHYSEITVKGVYHHRPTMVRQALTILADPAFETEHLLSGTRPIVEVEEALQSMIRKEALKVVIKVS